MVPLHTAQCLARMFDSLRCLIAVEVAELLYQAFREDGDPTSILATDVGQTIVLSMRYKDHELHLTPQRRGWLVTIE